MQFNDGSQLKLEPSGDVPIVFTDVDHTTARQAPACHVIS